MRFYHAFSSTAPDELSVDAALVTAPSGERFFSISACYVGPVDKGLGMHIMRYANEVRSAGQYFSDLPDQKLDPEMVGLASELIGRKAGTFKPEQYKNHYATALHDLVKEKARGHKIVVTEEERPSGTNVVDLMDALKRSVKGDEVAKGSTKGGEKASAKKKAGGGRRSA